MALEIERKFLVSGDGWKAKAVAKRHIRQAYLTKNERLSFRVRVSDFQHATLTLKVAAAAIGRDEYEYPIPLADAEELMLKREGALISKTRHLVREGGLMWEVDVFEGENAGLIVAEVELDRKDRPIGRPDWLGEEVTLERKFYNADLARHPFSQWRT